MLVALDEDVKGFEEAVYLFLFQTLVILEHDPENVVHVQIAFFADGYTGPLEELLVNLFALEVVLLNYLGDNGKAAIEIDIIDLLKAEGKVVGYISSHEEIAEVEVEI